MHILITVNAAWNIWNFRRHIVDALIADGHRVTVLAPADDSVTNLKSIGCHFLPLEMNVKGLNPLQDFKLIQRFKRVFRSERPDVILSYTIKNNIFGAMAAKAYKTPFVPNVTGLGTAFLSGGLLQAVAQGLYRKSFAPLSYIFFQNKDDQELFVKRGLVQSKQSYLLPGSGIDLEHFSAAEYPKATKGPVFLMIARLLRDKGVIEFVEAARQIKSRHPQVRFHLLGATGSENRSAIDATTVQDWVAEGVIHYLGTTNDVRPAILDASCVVLPSYREGAPRTLIEAAAMARPVITTDVPGCRAVIDRDVSGFLCQVRNAKSLASAIERFLELSPSQQQIMGRAGRIKMEREYDQVIVVQAYREVIANLIEK